MLPSEHENYFDKYDRRPRFDFLGPVLSHVFLLVQDETAAWCSSILLCNAVTLSRPRRACRVLFSGPSRAGHCKKEVRASGVKF